MEPLSSFRAERAPNSGEGLRESNQVGNKLLARASLAVVADVDHDELCVLDA
jgi:hypothetical protein